MQKDDIVFYVDHACVEIGRLGGKWDKDTWFVIPLAPFKHTAKRKEKFLRPINDFKKLLTNTK